MLIPRKAASRRAEPQISDCELGPRKTADQNALEIYPEPQIARMASKSGAARGNACAAKCRSRTPTERSTRWRSKRNRCDAVGVAIARFHDAPKEMLCVSPRS